MLRRGVRWRGKRRPLFAGMMAASFYLMSIDSTPAAQTDVVVATNDPSPDGNGIFDTTGAFSWPAINNSGWVVFTGSLQSFKGKILCFGNERITVPVLHSGASLFGGSVQSFNSPALNNADQALFVSNIFGANGTNYNLIKFDPAASQPFQQLLYGRQPAPDANGNFVVASPNGKPDFNDAGQALIVVAATNTAGGSNDDTGIYRTSVAGSLTKIAREGETAPGGNGRFDQFVDTRSQRPLINASGQVVFAAALLGATGGSNIGIYRGNGSTVTQIIRQGQALPGGGHVDFTGDWMPDMNDSGEVACWTYSPNDPTAGIYHIIVTGSGAALSEVARTGGSLPNNDTFGSLNGYVRINNLGQVAFLATGRHLNPSRTYWALFRSQDNGSNGIMIAADGQATPNGVGVFRPASCKFQINNSGQVAFATNLDNDPTDDVTNDGYGIFLYDSANLIQVARTGDPLLGSTITGLVFSGTNATGGSGSDNPTSVVPRSRSGLNDSGQITYGFALADGREGIAKWSPATPLFINLPAGSITKTTPGHRVQFKGTAGQRYVVQSSDAMAPRSWVNVTGSLTADGSGNYQYDDTQSPQPQRRFYRGTSAP